MLELFLNWDLKYTGLVTNFGLVPFVPWGTTRSFGQNNTQREGFYLPWLLAVGVATVLKIYQINLGFIAKWKPNNPIKRFMSYIYTKIANLCTNRYCINNEYSLTKPERGTHKHSLFVRTVFQYSVHNAVWTALVLIVVQF